MSVYSAGLRHKRRFSLYHPLTPYLFVLPAVIFFLVIKIYPIFSAFYLSFVNWDVMSPVKEFVGLNNYRSVLADKVFLTCIYNTFYYVVGVVLLGVPAALLIALGLSQMIAPVRSFLRAAYFLPVVTSASAVSVIWAWIFQPTFGLLNILMDFLGLPRQSWLLSPTLVMPSIILMSIWHGVGYNMVIFLAGLQGIPETYREAALIDGASPRQVTRYITLPLLKPTTIFVLITTTMGAWRVFTQVFVMTKGGPGHASDVIVLYIYHTAFSFLKMGKASSMAMILFGIILTFTLLQWKFGAKEVSYI